MWVFCVKFSEKHFAVNDDEFSELAGQEIVDLPTDLLKDLPCRVVLVILPCDLYDHIIFNRYESDKQRETYNIPSTECQEPF